MSDNFNSISSNTKATNDELKQPEIFTNTVKTQKLTVVL